MGGSTIGDGKSTLSLLKTAHVSMIVFVYFDGLCDSLPSMNGSKEKWPNEFNLASMLIRSDENRENMVDVSGATTPCDDGHFYEYG